MSEVKDGKIIDGRIELRISPKIEHGALKTVHALVLHQTGGSSADSTLESYKSSATGAHFLIDKDGTIYQTARITRKAFHVGKVRSKCFELKVCSAEEQVAIQTILKTKMAFKKKVKQLHEHESEKAYPARFPTNDDSIGIEVVGAMDEGVYENPTPEQDESVKWLVSELLAQFKLKASDIYRHPEVSYKDKTEAAAVTP